MPAAGLRPGTLPTDAPALDRAPRAAPDAPIEGACDATDAGTHRGRRLVDADWYCQCQILLSVADHQAAVDKRLKLSMPGWMRDTPEAASIRT